MNTETDTVGGLASDQAVTGPAPQPADDSERRAATR